MNIALLSSFLLLSLITGATQCMQEETDMQKESQYLFVVENEHTGNVLAQLISNHKQVQRDTSPDVFLRKEIGTQCSDQGMCHSLRAEAHSLFLSMHELQESTQATINLIPTTAGWGFHFNLSEPVTPERFRKIKNKSLFIARLLEGGTAEEYIKDKDARPLIVLLLYAACWQSRQNQ